MNKEKRLLKVLTLIALKQIMANQRLLLKATRKNLHSDDEPAVDFALSNCNKIFDVLDKQIPNLQSLTF